jgi:hypothetical protein
MRHLRQEIRKHIHNISVRLTITINIYKKLLYLDGSFSLIYATVQTLYTEHQNN